MKGIFFALIFIATIMGCSNDIKQENRPQDDFDFSASVVEQRFDANENLTYEKHDDGSESLREYGERINYIYAADGTCLIKEEYDSCNRKIHTIYVSSGAEYWYEYTTYENGNIKTVEKKTNNGHIGIYELDILGREIHYYDSEFECWWEYYDDGTRKKYFDSEGKIRSYNEDGRIVYQKDPDGLETFYDYNKNYSYEHFKCSDGYERWVEFDSEWNTIFYKDSEGNNSVEEYSEKSLP